MQRRWSESGLGRAVTLSALAFGLGAAGCMPDITSEQELEAQLQAAAAADGELADKDGAQGDALPGDGQGGGDAGTGAGDATADGGKIECLTPDDCMGKVLGKTSCRPLKCESGKCSLGQLPEGAPCVLSDALGECEQARCDAAGICAKVQRQDGTTCGPYTCGKKCEAGACVVATAADYDDANPCTSDYCKDGMVVMHEPLTDLSIQCDDGDPCTESGACVQGKCVGKQVECDNGVACAVGLCVPGKGCEFVGKDSLCDDGDPCSVDGCKGDEGCYTVAAAGVTVTCDDGDACTKADHCTAGGGCAGTPSCGCKTDADCADKATNLCLGPQVCTDGLCKADPAKKVTCDGKLDTDCLLNTCAPDTGECSLTPSNVGGPCDDGSKCTGNSTCTDQGACEGPADVKCDDKNPCTNDACDPTQGCVQTPNADTCDDGTACTSDDACSKGGCVGKQKVCDDGIACTTNACDAMTGACAFAPNDGACDDKNPCTTQSCDLKAGCVTKPDDTGTCDDGDACTKDKCQGGKCTAIYVCACKTDTDCDDKNPCTTDTCKGGACSSAAVADSEKKSCDPGDPCEKKGSGVCAAGACKSTGAKVDCSGEDDACNTGTCDPQTGACVKAAKGDGTGCDADGDGCTVGDQCKGGACAKGPAPDCSAKADACNDAACVSKGATSHACVAKPKAKGTACEDGKYCTVLDTCDGEGACLSGPLKSCASFKDVCNSGKCFEAEKQCGKKPKPATTQCNDGDFCTTSDHCLDGKCVGGAQMACPDGGACTSGLCDGKLAKCTVVPDKAGTACSDGSKCTSSDKCDGKGKCAGGVDKACTDPNPCLDAFCDPTTGGCKTKPAPAGTACSDGEPCTLSDTCDGKGACGGGPWNFKDPGCQCQTSAQCDDKNPCTLDSCKSKQCEFTVTDGKKCDDGTPCTTKSECDKNGACVGTKTYDCTGSADDCNEAFCTAVNGSATCQKKPKAAGTKCDDGQWCTQPDLCDAAGKCISKPRGCDDGVACTNDACIEKDQKCKHKSSCDDFDKCTKDTCDKASGKCVYTAAVDCDDGNVCTVDSCDPNTGDCNHSPTGPLPCSDGDACTVSDQCQSGACAGQPKSCNDGNVCTKDKCDSKKGGCVFKNADGTPCSDGVPCTVKDTCSGGQCLGTTRTCEDYNKCTTDSCIETGPYAGRCSNKKTVGGGWKKCDLKDCSVAGDCPTSSDPCFAAKCKITGLDDGQPVGYCTYKESCLSTTP